MVKLKPKVKTPPLSFTPKKRTIFVTTQVLKLTKKVIINMNTIRQAREIARAKTYIRRFAA